MNCLRRSFLIRAVAASVSLCLLASCGSFHSEWKQATAATRSLPKDSVEGPWTGTWKSEATGHVGRLRCVVGPAENREGDHVFRYHASWGRVFAASFTARHRVEPSAEGTRFSGSHEMPAWVGGTYRYDGVVKGDAFSATYRSSKDHGAFEMRRPRAEARRQSSLLGESKTAPPARAEPDR